MAEAALKTRIMDAMKAAMRAHEKQRLGAIRLIQADMKRIEVDERIELDDARIVVILDKMLKQRRDSIQHFETAGRQDLIDIEVAEVAVIQEFLPQALSDAEIDTMIAAALQETGATTIKDMGKVMGILKPKVQGRADMGAVSQRIKTHLG